MANNRMFLRCRGCGEDIMLGKTLGGDWYYSLAFGEKGRELYDFISHHCHCCKDLEKDTCGCYPTDSFNFEPFELIYENNEDYGERKTLQQLDRELHPDKYQ